MAEGMRETILEQAREDARQIIKQAEARADDVIAAAVRQKKRQDNAIRDELLARSRQEAVTIRAQAAFEATQLVEGEKRTIVNEIIAGAIARLNGNQPDRHAFQQLVAEALKELGPGGKAKLMVRQRDLALAREIVDDSALSRQVVEVSELECLGGVRVESADGMVAIDNTFDTRLEMVLPHVLPGIAARIFGARPR